MANKENSILYLSHGKPNTGGYFHEIHLAKSLAIELNSQLVVERYEQYFEGSWGHLQLLIKGFKAARAAVIISVARLSIPVLLRNIFNNSKIILVWHYHDERTNISWTLKSWYAFSIFCLKLFPASKCKVVVVAPFWEKYFSAQIGPEKVSLFPNFFEPQGYQKFEHTPKKKMVHLGQVSFKNHPDLAWIAKQLKLAGFSCYFSTNDNAKMYDKQFEDIEIRYFKDHESYLSEMAAALYTLALPYFNEGWNRVAHESLLVGTSVIGYAKGGLADLLTLANAGIAQNKEEVVNLVLSRERFGNKTLLKAYAIENTSGNLVALKNWIKKL